MSVLAVSLVVVALVVTVLEVTVLEVSLEVSLVTVLVVRIAAPDACLIVCLTRPRPCLDILIYILIDCRYNRSWGLTLAPVPTSLPDWDTSVSTKALEAARRVLRRARRACLARTTRTTLDNTRAQFTRTDRRSIDQASQLQLRKLFRASIDACSKGRRSGSQPWERSRRSEQPQPQLYALRQRRPRGRGWHPQFTAGGHA